MPARRCMYREQPVYDGSGYHPECVPKAGQSGERARVVAAPAPARTAESVLNAANLNAVRIVDVDMPFGSMVYFMIKWSLATIPAMFVLTLFAMAAVAIIMAIFHLGPKIP